MAHSMGARMRSTRSVVTAISAWILWSLGSASPIIAAGPRIPMQCRKISMAAEAQQPYWQKFARALILGGCSKEEVAFSCEISIGKATCYVWRGYDQCSPERMLIPANCVLSYATATNEFRRLNIEPYSRNRHIFQIRPQSEQLSEFHTFLDQAGLRVRKSRKQDLAFLFAFLVYRLDADLYPTDIVMSSADLRRHKALSDEQRAILALPEEATALQDKNHFTTYLRWNNGDIMRVEMTFKDSSSIGGVTATYLAPLPANY